MVLRVVNLLSPKGDEKVYGSASRRKRERGKLEKSVQVDDQKNAAHGARRGRALKKSATFEKGKKSNIWLLLEEGGADGRRRREEFPDER